jgi:outer membrane PBP1 activator LpoA protein
MTTYEELAAAWTEAAEKQDVGEMTRLRAEMDELLNEQQKAARLEKISQAIDLLNSARQHINEATESEDVIDSLIHDAAVLLQEA